MYKCFPHFNLMCNRVFARFWWWTYPVRGVCPFDTPHSTFKPLNSMVLFPNRPNSVSSILAYVFLVDSSLQVDRVVHRPRTGQHWKAVRGVNFKGRVWVSHTPCAGYGFWWAVVLLRQPRLDHFSLPSQSGSVPSSLVRCSSCFGLVSS